MRITHTDGSTFDSVSVPKPYRILPDGRVVDGDLANDPAKMAELGFTEWEAPPTPQLPLAEYKAAAIERNRDECTRRILALWPEAKQRNANAGHYSAAVVVAKDKWITDHVKAENTAANTINEATSHAGVDAVTPAWPEAS